LRRRSPQQFIAFDILWLDETPDHSSWQVHKGFLAGLRNPFGALTRQTDFSS